VEVFYAAELDRTAIDVVRSTASSPALTQHSPNRVQSFLAFCSFANLWVHPKNKSRSPEPFNLTGASKVFDN